MAASAALAAWGCQSDEPKPDTIPFTAAEPPKPASPGAASPGGPGASAAPGSSTAPGAGATPATPGGTGTLPRPAGTAASRGESIDACCAALRSKSDRKSKQAASLCAGMAPAVRDGKTSRSAALRQLRIASGTTLPGACN